ncbi:hypothetical protein CBL_07548 [Carabus blaptoides fortunei]
MVCENATSTITTSRMVNTRLDHVEGMLDRDQRTVRTRSVHQVNNTSNHTHGYPTTMTTTQASSSSVMGSSSYTLTTIPSNTMFDLESACGTYVRTMHLVVWVSHTVREWYGALDDWATPRFTKSRSIGPRVPLQLWQTLLSTAKPILVFVICTQCLIYPTHSIIIYLGIALIIYAVTREIPLIPKSLQTFLEKLKRALVLSVYLLSVFYIPKTSCAPMRNMEERMNSHPKWINPCGMGNNPTSHEGEGISVDEKDLLSQIEWQAQIAFDAAKNFRDEYVQKTFKMEFDQYHQTWKQNRYDWLPTKEQIPKSLSEATPSKHLEVLELNKSLLDTYEYLQTLAVGLEQIVWDQEDQEEEDFLVKFKEAEYKLRSLLCEIQVAIIERGLNMRPDVRRDIMTDPYRNMSNTTSRYFRDWVIFRDYMNALEYVVDVFRHFKKDL